MDTPTTAEPLTPDTEPDWPPATPPEPPMFADRLPEADDARDPLTSVPWSVGAATLFVLAMVAMTVAAAVGARFLRELSLGQTSFTYLVGLLLGGSYLAVIGVAWVAAVAAGEPFSRAFGLRRTSVRTLVLAALLATLGGRVLAGAWGLLVEYLGVELPGSDVDPSALFPPTALGIAMTVLVAGIIAPVAEEIIFRGVLLSALDRRWGASFAIVVSSAVFALMHVTPFAIPPIFGLSLILGWLFVRTRSLTVCIVAHAAFNVTGLAALYALKASGAL